MAKSDTAKRDFLSQIRRQHTPRSDRFEVTIGAPGGLGLRKNRLATLMCEEAQIPGLSATNVPVKIGPWTEYRTQNVEYLTTEAVFSFLVDGNWELRSYFEEWIHLSADFRNKEVSFYNKVVCEIDVKSLDTEDNIIGHWKLHDAVPKLLNITPVAWGNSQLLRCSLSVSAKRWTNQIYNYAGNVKSSQQP
tara:strand:+ start:208 stop:780 length:573 start_codon:yes stop_codon:yes gene_type:complete